MDLLDVVQCGSQWISSIFWNILLKVSDAKVMIQMDIIFQLKKDGKVIMLMSFSAFISFNVFNVHSTLMKWHQIEYTFSFVRCMYTLQHDFDFENELFFWIYLYGFCCRMEFEWQNTYFYAAHFD